jgi:hypothetical protein
MVRAAVADRDQNATPEDELNRDLERVPLALSPIELDIIIDALRSVGNVELAERLETVLRQWRQPPET